MKFYIRIVFFTFIIGLGVFAKEVYAADFDLTPIHYSSPEAIDILFVGDGFTEQEQSFFQQKAQEAESYFLNSLPIKNRKSDFNTYYLELNSNESGISVEGGTQVDTALGVYRNCDGTPRISCISDWGKEKLYERLRKLFGKRVYVYLISNYSGYIGSGEFPENDVIASIGQSSYDSQHGYFRELVIHEMGHSFGDLADEYGGTCDDQSRPTDWDPVKYDKKNVTHDAVNDRKWDFLPNPQYILGANYCTNEWYRSSQNGIMRSFQHGAEHNELGQYLINERIDEDLEYNRHLISFIQDGAIPENITSDTNVRVNADRVTLDHSIQCNELFVAKGAKLIVSRGVSINCNSIIKKGKIIYSRDTRDRRGRGSRRRHLSFRKRFIFPKKKLEQNQNFDKKEEKYCRFPHATRFLSLGDRGEDVKELQHCLNEVYGEKLREDGIFNKETKQKVEQFQRMYKLHTIDGVVGPETYHALAANE